MSLTIEKYVVESKKGDYMEEKIKQLCIDGLLTDGAHHKQWYLEEILKVLGVDLVKLREELQTPDEKGDYYDWEDGIAP